MHKKKLYIILLIIILIFGIYIPIGFINNLVTTDYIYTNNKIPKEFDGYKILVISDLHCKNFGKNQDVLISAIENANPDIIVITGDTIDEYHLVLDSVEDLFKGIQDIAPIFHITGNHELSYSSIAQYEKLQALMDKYNIVDLDNSQKEISIDNSTINIFGSKYYSKYVTQFLKTPDISQFNILLYHGSDDFDIISPFGYDLVISGHAHGGVIRLPFIGGVIGNDGEFFPKYTKGMYNSQTSTLLVSRGLGNIFIPRFYNKPEIVVVTLKNED